MTETAFKILLVEDNRKLADLVCDACKRDSSSPVYDIIVFARVDEVLVAGDGAGFDLILVGIGLAGTDSIEATETLSARYPGTPIMVLTPENDPAFAVNAIDAGARDCLGGDEIGSPLLQRMARHIIERNRIQRRADKLRTRQAGESEMLQLKNSL